MVGPHHSHSDEHTTLLSLTLSSNSSIVCLDLDGGI